MIIRDWKKDFWTIPNMLSLFRLVLIPVYTHVYLHAQQAHHYAIAAGILAVSCLTDMIDGQIARRFDMISTMGKFLDPLADKATQFTLLLCLAIKHPILWFLAWFMIAKESFQLIACIVAFRRGKMLAGALMTGKVCTFILFFSLILLVLLPNLPTTAVRMIAAIDGMAMVVSFIHYVFTYTKKTPMIQDIVDHRDRLE